MEDKCKDCPYLSECSDACAFGYCPCFNDYEDDGDIGSATIRELRLQNGDL